MRFIISLTILCFSCVKDSEFKSPEKNCNNELVANISFLNVINLYQGETIQIQENWILESYVVSSDKAGNFFGELYIQDSADQPNGGLKIEIDLRDSYLWYPVGSKVFIKLKGLFLGKNKEGFKLGGAVTFFGNLSVGRLPKAVLKNHLIVSCGDRQNIEPLEISLDMLMEVKENTLVRLKNLEFVDEELRESFAVKAEETNRLLKDCQGNLITLVNSGYSDFQETILPNLSGSITGVLVKNNQDFNLRIRSLEDIEFKNERCPKIVDEFTSNAIFISELADPDNAPEGRFIELYNSDNNTMSLKGWKLLRYTNNSTEVSSSTNLTDYSILGKSTLVISSKPDSFEIIYGFLPDVLAGANSAANSNGDDNIVLVDPFGKTVDVFGVIGEDGSGTNHEFEDGRAVRNTNISKGNTFYNYMEWTIYNDSGEAQTTNQPQTAPENFTPGKH